MEFAGLTVCESAEGSAALILSDPLSAVKTITYPAKSCDKFTVWAEAFAQQHEVECAVVPEKS